MNYTGLVVAISLSVILFTACNSSEQRKTSPKVAESLAERKAVEFTKPAMIIIQQPNDNYRLSNSKELEALIIKANDLSIEIAIMPVSDLKFFKIRGGETLLNQESLYGTELVLFNGNEIILTTPESETAELFDVFFKSLSSGRLADNHTTTRSSNKRTAGYYGKSSTYKQSQDNVNVASGNLISSIKEMKAVDISAGKNDTYTDIIPVIITNPALNSYLWPFSNISLALENDLFSNTDRYFTNGVQIRLSSPALAFWRINSILPVSIKGSMEYNSIELNHEMYTPYTTKLPPVLKDDRPYASALYIRFIRKAENPEKAFTQEASVDIGVIGKASLGGLLQKSVHAGIPDNDEPLGWETQIGNDLIINYRYALTKLLITTGKFHAFTITAASLGTFNTSASTGIGFKTGTSPYFIAPLPNNFIELNKQPLKKWTYTFEGAMTSSIVGYNATLSGGLLNKNNIYVLEPKEIERLLFKAELGFNLYYQNYGLRIAQHFITNEFKKGKHHFWGEMGLNIGL